MARGRMINSKIVMNRAINGLSDDTSRLAFTWLITFADVEGRTYGDPALLRSMLFPRRTDITIEQMDGYVREWIACGLADPFTFEGDARLALKLEEERRPTEPVSQWRKAVFERDDYTCQGCGARGVKLNAHHVAPWATSPALRFDVDNGITLCKACHRLQHGKGWMGEAEQ